MGRNNLGITKENFFDRFVGLIWRNPWITLIIIFGIFLRLHRFPELYHHAHDQDLSAWIVRDILSGHFRLIGQLTSQPGVFIGPLYYYLLVPFYFFSNMDPVGGVFLSAAIGGLAIWSIYYIFSKVGDKSVGFFGSLIYSVGNFIIWSDREVVPTTPAMLWSIWFFYCVWLLTKDKLVSGLFLLGVLMGLVWHINLSLGLLLPLAFLAIVLSGSKLKLKHLLIFTVPFVFLISPFIVFELRHGFIQTQAIVSGFTSVNVSGDFAAKLDHVVRLATRNINGLFLSDYIRAGEKFLSITLLASLVILTIKGQVKFKFTILLFSWVALFIIFFTLNNIILSEYYLLGMQVVWIFIVSSILGYAAKYNKTLVLIFAFMFTFYNLNIYFKRPINKSGYKEKRELVQYIKEDARRNNYPCIAVSYMTKPGFDLGYRYVFLLEDMHVNVPSNGSPVYSIVFPLSMVDGHIDKSFGALGLIMPDYERYDFEQVKASCVGENPNEVGSMFGYVD